MSAALRGLDVLVFTGGVGEHSAQVRADAAARLAWLGAAVDPDRNAGAVSDTEITGAGASVRTLVVTAREDLQIAHEVANVLGGG
jgi:acetate kinase